MASVSISKCIHKPNAMKNVFLTLLLAFFCAIEYISEM